MLATLRQQGGATVLTVPTTIIKQMGWQIGSKIELQAQGETVVLRPLKRQAKGQKSVSELLAGIDSQEIQQLNTDIAELKPVGKEVW